MVRKKKKISEKKLGKSSNGKDMHYSVGAIIKKGDKYLLIDRAIPPYGLACPAGHVDEGEEKEEALIREIKEETGLKIESLKLVAEEELDWNWCSKGITVHYWYVFDCRVNGVIRKNGESKSINWYSKEEIMELKLEPSWEYWLKKLKVI